MFSRLSNKNRGLKKLNNCAKTTFVLASVELTVLPSSPRKLGCPERTVLPEEPFFVPHKTCVTSTSCQNCTYDCTNPPGQESHNHHRLSPARGRLPGEVQPLRTEMRLSSLVPVSVEKGESRLRRQKAELPEQMECRDPKLVGSTIQSESA